MTELLNEDNMAVMSRYPDKYFDLAIVDPPYGIGSKMTSGGPRNEKFGPKTNVEWDNVPTKKYWDELFRVSKNQIVWGGNYFIEHLGNTRCMLIWDKIQKFSGADFEIAWTSFDMCAKAFRMSRVQAYSKGKIHICQKPIELYKWILENYAKQGEKILDTHLGSGSIAIACHDLGFDLVATEIDKDYYEAAVKRFNEQTRQLKLIA